MSATYEQKSNELAAAIDIAICCFETYKPNGWDEIQVNHFVNTYSNFKKEILFPEPKYKNLTSLKYHEDAVFTYFNESGGKSVEHFWQKIREQNLPYKRVNRMNKILKRKRIKDDIEYNFVIDVMMPYFEQGLINASDLEILNTLISKFENK